MNKKIAITGMGVISATGKGITETSASLRAGKRNAGKPSVFKTETNCPVFEIKDVADRGGPVLAVR